ncbi:MAG: hypothetical protein JWR80_8164, partial [Bradyrhizobium sp.]|nr:hypothetical protein [Bradyrhizobium sp.]
MSFGEQSGHDFFGKEGEVCGRIGVIEGAGLSHEHEVAD